MNNLVLNYLLLVDGLRYIDFWWLLALKSWFREIVISERPAGEFWRASLRRRSRGLEAIGSGTRSFSPPTREKSSVVERFPVALVKKPNLFKK